MVSIYKWIKAWFIYSKYRINWKTVFDPAKMHRLCKPLCSSMYCDYWTLKSHVLGKAIFDRVEDLCKKVDASFAVPNSFEDMQSVFKDSNEDGIIIWTPLMKISTSEYIDRDWDLLSFTPKSDLEIENFKVAYFEDIHCII